MTQTELLDRDGKVTEIARARHEAEEGMRRALDHADDVCPRWSDNAYTFLCNFAARQSAPFTGEDVTRASIEWGLIQPPTTRAWGSLYRRAQNEGLIVWVDNDGKRANGNATPRYRRGRE